MAGPPHDDEFPEVLDPELSALARVLRSDEGWQPDESWRAAAKERLLEAYDQQFGA